MLGSLPQQSILASRGPSFRSRQRPNSARSDGPARLAPSQAANTDQDVASRTLLSAHPDAVRRRQQAQARKAVADYEAQRAHNREWWNGALPKNLISVSSPDAFQAAIAQNKLVVVDFFAPWCMACRRLFPALMKLAENNPDIVFIKVNGGDTVLSQFVESLAVDKLPYFHFYREGSLISHFAANLTKMNMLRAEIAAQKDSVLSAIFDKPYFQEGHTTGDRTGMNM